VTGPKLPDPSFEDFEEEVYRRWQKREEANDKQVQAHHNKLIIENGDPECEKVIAALEKGWTGER